MKTVLLSVFLIFVILLFLPLYINVVFKKENRNNFLEINFILIKGLIRVGFDIPLMDIIKRRNKLQLKIKDKVEKGKKGKEIKKEERDIPFTKLFQKAKYMRKKSYLFKKPMDYILRKIQISKLIWITKVGVNDAALTGICTGALWSVKSVIISYLMNYKSITITKINVTPIYSEKLFEVYFDCIIRLKLVYIITAGYYGLIAKLKGGESSV